MEIIFTALRAIPYLVILIMGALILSYIWLLWDNWHTFKIAKQLPGPPGLPIIGNIHQIAGDGYETLNKMMALLHIYPGIVRLWFGPKLVIVTDEPDVLKTLLNHPEALNKPYLYFVLDLILKNGLVTSETPKWRRHRKVLSPPFNPRVLDTYVEIFSRKSSILAKQLKELSGKKYADVYHAACECTSDIICETAIGIDMGVQVNNYQFVEQMETLLSMMNYRTFSVWYHLDIIWKFTPSSKILDRSLKYLCDLLDMVLHEKLNSYNNQKDKSLKSDEETEEQPKKRKAILDFLYENSSFTNEEFIEEIYTFITAGTETTAATFSFTCLMLAMFPDIQQKVYEEVISVMGDVDDILPDRLKDLEYTERVIKETMRLFPIAPLIGRQTTADIPTGDLTIPRGSIVLVGIANLHRNPKYWPDPLKFDPDRFLPEEVAKRHPCVHIPFSYGLRNCIGARYAMMNLKTMLSFVITRFTLHTDYKSVDEIKITMSLFLKIKDGLKLWLESRDTEDIRI